MDGVFLAAESAARVLPFVDLDSFFISLADLFFDGGLDLDQVFLFGLLI